MRKCAHLNLAFSKGKEVSVWVTSFKNARLSQEFTWIVNVQREKYNFLFFNLKICFLPETSANFKLEKFQPVQSMPRHMCVAHLSTHNNVSQQTRNLHLATPIHSINSPQWKPDPPSYFKYKPWEKCVRNAILWRGLATQQQWQQKRMNLVGKD